MLASILFVLLNYEAVYQFIDKSIIQKISQETESGIMRSLYFDTHLDYYLNMNLLSMLFGLGFGYVRSTDFFTTLLINNGLIGLLLFSAIFLKPVFLLNNNKRNYGLKVVLVTLYFSMLTAVPEFSFLSTWLFLGVAYNQLKKEKAGVNALEITPAKQKKIA